MPRVVAVGVGAANRLLPPLLADQGHELVGVLGRGAAVGRDFGELAGGAPLGVEVEADLPALLARTMPDVAVISTVSTLGEAESQLDDCIRAGVHVVTIAEEAVSPFATGGEVADRIDALARAHGVSIIGSGHTDQLWIALPVQLAAITTRLTAIHGVSTRPLFARDDTTHERLAIGRPAEAFPSERHDGPRSGACWSSLAAIADALGLTVTSSETVVEPDLAEVATEFRTRAGIPVPVAVGTVGGVVTRAMLGTAEGIELRLADIARVGASSAETWTVDGTPSATAAVDVTGGLVSTMSQVVNRIPDVIAAPAGLLPHVALPPLRHRVRSTA